MNTTTNKTILALSSTTEWDIIATGNPGNKDYRNVRSACKGSKYERDMLMLYMFQLGIIYGKKIERARRNGTAVTPLDDGGINGNSQ